MKHHQQHNSHEGNSHPHENRALIQPAISFLLLTIGIVLNHLPSDWFCQPTINLLWFIAAFLPVGLPVLKEGWKALKAKEIFNEFTLMTVACIGAFYIGEYPEAVAVMLFYTIGEWFQHRAVGRATTNIRQLLDVRPEKTLVMKEGQLIETSPREVTIGEEIEVRPGERVPLDGELLDTTALFDTSALTGESMPRTIEQGGEVLAGMIACDSPTHIRVNRPYDESALAKILVLVKEASERKAPAELFIRRFARIYTPVVILLAMAVIALPSLFVEPYVFSEWLYRGLVFLVISCPCALVISVPLGYFAGIGAASRTGILLKGGNYLDAMTRINAVAFDKTGTLTTGTFQVTDISLGEVSKEKLLSLVLTIESKSTHPIAKAVSEYAEKEGITTPALISSIKEIPGEGMEARINGQLVAVGNLRLMSNRGISFPEELWQASSTLVVCAIDGKYAGALFLSDTIKPDAIEAIHRLQHLGIQEIQLLSGDKKEVVAECAAKMGIDKAFGGLLPEDKAQHIDRLMNHAGRNVAFVGDGMNDAPVLALSHVGVAMGGLGSDAAVESADVVIQTDQPSKLATAILIGRATRRIVRENIFWAIAVKVVVLTAGALGYASLWAAVFADVGVSLLAVLNSLRILYKKFEINR